MMQEQRQVGYLFLPLVLMLAYPLVPVHRHKRAYQTRNELLALMLVRHRFCAIVRLGLMSLLAYLPVA
jgi:hypothetical protein